MNERNDKMRKDEFKINFFFDENGPTFEELVMEAFEEIVMEHFEEIILEIIEKYNNKNNFSLSNTEENNTEKVEN